jgi:predicted TIM-barrel enzyme
VSDPTQRRDDILGRLRDKVASGRPILISSASNGLVAKLLERAGADCVNTFSGARLRANGMGTMSMLWPILDANKQTLEYTEQDVLPALEGKAFVCACLNFNDPLRNMHVVFNRLIEMGVPSVSNIGPSISYVDKDSQVFKVLNSAGVTFENEIKALQLAKDKGMVTIGVAFDLEDSLQMVEQAQPHLFCYHAGTTKGGLAGYDRGESIAETAARSETAFGQLRAAKGDILLIAHGAAMETPEEAQYMLQHTSVDGIWTGSSTERLPIERAVTEAATRFASLRLARGATA